MQPTGHIRCKTGKGHSPTKEKTDASAYYVCIYILLSTMSDNKSTLMVNMHC